jgi:uncharacterized protein
MRLLRTIAAGLVVLCLGAASAAAFEFPLLTGRVVDQANIINEHTKADVTERTKDLEEKSGIQLVVTTVRSLDGSEIEPYATALFKTWRLGQAEKNNGVLLLVAPKEHKVRIEVGYGLESTLTNDLCAGIIRDAIIPSFKVGDFSSGVERGVDGIIEVLSRDKASWQPPPKRGVESSLRALWEFFLGKLGISGSGNASNSTAGGG